MSGVLAGERRFAVDAVVFDKDGTLIALDPMWAGRALRWINRIAASDRALRAELIRLIGIDEIALRVLPDRPLAVTTLDRLYTLTAGVLLRRGSTWSAAEALVTTAGVATLGAPLRPDEVQPIGDVRGTLHRLRAAGLRLAVLTSDDRAASERGLALLGIADLIDTLVCADDGLPPKPDPAGLHAIAQRLGVPPARLLLVGDSLGDMQVGRQAGVAGCIGIAPPAGAGRLAAIADLVLPTVASLRPADTD